MDNFFNINTESGLLKISIAATIMMSLFGVIIGLLSNSSTIIYDGIYEMIDASMTVLALAVANLIQRSYSGDFIKTKLAERFTMGFWHLEPIVLGMNGILLISASLYALINAFTLLRTGGKTLNLDYAILYAGISFIIECSMAYLISKQNKLIRSSFLRIDANAWKISVGMTLGLLAAFITGKFLENTSYASFVPYIDPLVLIVVCLVIIPIPLGSVKQAIEDILLVTPVDLKHKVDGIAAQIAERYGFADFHTYVARVGRSKQIEVYFIVKEGEAPRPLEEWDAIRNKISKEIGEDNPDRWLTIVFTTNPEWA